MESRWEVFNPVDGEPLYAFRSRFLARLVSWWFGLDFELEGQGWIKL
jgi:hypothetical protein